MMSFGRAFGTFAAIMMVFLLATLLAGTEVAINATALFIAGLASSKAYQFYKGGDKPKAIGMVLIAIWMLYLVTSSARF